MNSSLDLNLLFIARQSGNVTSELPDLYAVTPPRRPAHGRESDSLIIYLTMTGNSPLSPEAQSQLLEQLAQKFYKTSGSLTSALRTIVDSVNLFLLDRNLRSTSVGRQGIGQLLLLALRGDTLYMAHCGGVHAFNIKPDKTQHIYDPQSSGRGLGLSRTTPIRFIQIKMDAGDYLVLATIAPSNWSELSLTHPQQQGIEAIRRQLLEDYSQEFNAVIIQAQAGAGKLRYLKPKANAPDIVYPVASDQTSRATSPTSAAPTAQSVEYPAEDHRLGIPSDEVAASEIAEQPAEDKGLGVSPASPASQVNGSVYTKDRGLGVSSNHLPTASVSAGEIYQGSDEPVYSTPLSTSTASQSPVSVSPDGLQQEIQPMETTGTAEAIPGSTVSPALPRKARSISQPSPFAKYVATFRSTLAPIGATILRALQSALATIGAALWRLIKNLLPDADVLRVPPSMMLFVAIVIPLILAVIGGMVFLQRGRAQQHQIYYQKAAEEAAYAATLTNPLEQRLAWQSVIGDLDKAEYYTLTSQSQALRAEATSNLDLLDAIKRLDFKQAIVGGLDSGINVTRIVATTTDMYLLNGKEGNVLHAIMTGRGYEIDLNFQCGPTYGPINVGPLVDIAELPPGSFENASLLGMDANGNLLYCVIGSQPYSAAMAPPNTGFGEPSAMSLDRGDLYLLDPKVNAVWIYRNMEVSQQPRLFFGDDIPPMQDVIDLTVYNNDLFLLHADGHTTKCIYSGMAESPTRCDDPYPYSDNRPGRVHGPTIQDAVFNQVYFSSFPERSIYMLDPQNQSIYYFSVLLTLQWQYQSKSSLPEGKATAFAISPNRMAFLAIGSYVYYAAMP
ncbi:MAG: hypothetical protein WAV05_15310 [Anaerolineales bacterium]